MPQVHYVKKARRAIPSAGVEVGKAYWWWATRITAGKSYIKQLHYSVKPPRQSQLTNGKMAGVYAANESVEDAIEAINKDLGDNPKLGIDEDHFTSAQSDLSSALNEAAESVREVAEEYREGASNIEDGFGHSTSTSDDMSEKADELDSYADTLESAAGDVDNVSYEAPEVEDKEEPETEEDDAPEGVDPLDTAVPEDDTPDPPTDSEPGDDPLESDEDAAPPEVQASSSFQEMIDIAEGALGESP
jgi:uncharacterized phage infection (PIP) family protein YhgE